MRRPASGCSRSKRSRMRRRTGISRSAHSMRRTPSAARPRSVTSWRQERPGRWRVIGVGLLAGEEAAEAAQARSGQRRAEAMDEALLEADVLGVAEAAVGVERGRIVGADVEDDLVAGPEQLRGHRAGHRGRVAAAAVVDDGSGRCRRRRAGPRADDVGAGGRDEPAVDADAVVDAVGDRRRRQPRREAELVQPVELADVGRQEPLDVGRVRAGSGPGRPTSGPSRARGRRGTSRSTAPRTVGQHATYAARGRMTSRRIAAMPSGVAHHEQRLGRQAGVLEDERRPVRRPRQRHAPAGPRELAVLEVAEGVRGEQPVAFEERAQQRPVRGRCGPPGRRVGPSRRWPSAGAPRRVRRGTRARAVGGPGRAVAARRCAAAAAAARRARLERRRGRRPPR